MQPQTIEILATVVFAVAVLHTFAAKQLERLSHRLPRHAGLLHLLAEVEVVFGFWAIVLMTVVSVYRGVDVSIGYVE